MGFHESGDHFPNGRDTLIHRLSCDPEFFRHRALGKAIFHHLNDDICAARGEKIFGDSISQGGKDDRALKLKRKLPEDFPPCGVLAARLLDCVGIRLVLVESMMAGE